MLQKTSVPQAGHIKDVPIFIASLAEHERNAGEDIIGVSVGDKGPFFILHGGDATILSLRGTGEKRCFSLVRNDGRRHDATTTANSA